MGLRPLYVFISFSAGVDLRRQNIATNNTRSNIKLDPRAERVWTLIKLFMNVYECIYESISSSGKSQDTFSTVWLFIHSFVRSSWHSFINLFSHLPVLIIAACLPLQEFNYFFSHSFICVLPSYVKLLNTVLKLMLFYARYAQLSLATLYNEWPVCFYNFIWTVYRVRHW